MRVRKIVLGFVGAVAIPPLVLIGAWGTLALWHRLPGPEILRDVVAGIFAAVSLVTVVALFTRQRWRALAIFFVLFGAILLWWRAILPPTDGDWASDVARQTTGRLDGDILTLSDVRDFEWRSESDFTPRWSERTYDLSKLKTLDLYLDYWAGPQMAHLIMSFGFEDGDYLAWSVEIRRKKDGEYSPIADAFKQDTLVTLATTERDFVRLRSNIRHEDLRLYRLNTPPEQARIFLMGYVADANALHAKPRFYNSITTNCTTAVARMIRALGGKLPLDWRLLVNGYLPGYLYENKVVVETIPLEELIARADINARARSADQSPEFSRIIREGVPSPF